MKNKMVVISAFVMKTALVAQSVADTTLPQPDISNKPGHTYPKVDQETMEANIATKPLVTGPNYYRLLLDDASVADPASALYFSTDTWRRHL